MTIVYSAIATIVLIVLVQKTVDLRLPEHEEMAGMDHSLHGELGYGLLNVN